MKLLRVLCLPLVLVAVSCGGDESTDADGIDGGDSAGDVEAFCERLRELDTGDTIDVDEGAETAMAEMRALRDAAPAGIRDDLDTVLEIFEQVAELEASGAEDEDAFGEVFELIFDPEFVAASERLEQFGVDECGLEPSTDGLDDDVTNGDVTNGDVTNGDGTSDASGQAGTNDDGTNDASGQAGTNDDGTSDASGQAGTNDDGTSESDADGLITEAADVPDPLFDPFFDDDVVDPSELSINGLQYHLDVNHTDAPWRTRLTSFSIGGSVGVGGLELDDVAVEVCNAVAEYVVQFEPDWEITIESYAQDDTGQYNYVGDLVTGSANDGC